jgi:hypothetical protein
MTQHEGMPAELQGNWADVETLPLKALECVPVYLGFFEFVHNVRKRGKALLPALIEILVT